MYAPDIKVLSADEQTKLFKQFQHGDQKAKEVV